MSTQTCSSPRKQPSHKLFHLRKYEKDGKEKTYWTPIGIAYTNKDKSIQLVASLPVVLLPGESFQLRDFDEKPKAQKQGEQAPPADHEDDDIPF